MSARIPLGKGYVLSSDSQQFILKRVYEAKEGKGKGEPVERAIGYYLTLEDAFKGLVQHRVLSETEATSMDELLKEIQSIHKGIQALFKKASKEFKA